MAEDRQKRIPGPDDGREPDPERTIMSAARPTPPENDEDLTRLPTADTRALPTDQADSHSTAVATAHSSVAQPDGADDGPLTVGKPFGPRYEITRLLGAGGMGAVYEAWDHELGVPVAVKVIRPEIAANPATGGEMERRFKRELLLARQVTHPNIIRIHDLGDINGIKYITMPFIDGADLATILKNEKKLRVRRALRIARGTIAGLVSAHQAGVVHRDLKPANIMVGIDDAPTIMDFGIARSAGAPAEGKPAAAVAIRPADLSRTAAAAVNSTMAGAIVGTVAYMAPEQARGEVVDQRADLYAFGLILYDMLVGGRRFDRAASAIAELHQRMETAPPAPRTVDPSIPEALDEIIRRCLEPAPAKRFQTSVELQHALDRLDDEGRPLPIMRRVSRRAMLASAAIVALLLAATFYTARQVSTPEAPRDPISVVIADFQNNTADTTFDGAIEQTLRRGLESASFISAYDRNRIRGALGVQAPERLDETAARELAVKQGLGVVLAGAIDPRGNGFEISARAVETITGNVIGTARSRAGSKDEVLSATAEVMSSIRNALGDNTSDSEKLFAMRTMSASSLDVVRHYADAIEAQANGRLEQARESYLKAVELDPNFGLGYQGLAAMSRNLGRLEDADRYFKEALRHLDTMTDRERFATRGLYYRHIGDNQQCAKEYGDLLARYPADTVAHIQRASCLAQLKQMREAMNAARQAVNMVPNHVGYRTNLALLTNFAGDFAAAEQEVRRIPQPTATAMLAAAYSQMGRGLLKEATTTYTEMAKLGAAGVSAGASGLADIAIYEGRYRDAIAILEKSAAADLAAKSTSRAAIKYASIAHAEAARGRKAAAVAAAEKALEHSKTMAVRFLAARALVSVGAVQQAEALAVSLTSELPATPQAHGKIILGELALARGDHNEAVRILTEANTQLDTWVGRFTLGRAYLAAGAHLQADSEFDRCLLRRGEALSLMDEGPTFGHVPPVYYFLGRVREAMGTAGFADAYREYLRIRGGSTEDPLVPEVRKRAGD